MKIILLSLFAILFAYATSCISASDRMNKSDKSALNFSDSIFYLHNIKTSELKNLEYEYPNLYSDKSKQHSFHKLDSSQVMKYLAPFVKIELEYLTKYMDAYLISKQEDIYSFTPITILLEGDDYESLIYILLDKDLSPVSHYVLRKNDCAGPASETDSTTTSCPEMFSFLNGKEIDSYVLIFCESNDTIKKPAIVDSIRYKAIISSAGKITTQRLDSVRYSRIVEWN